MDAGVGKLLVLGAALGCLSTCLTVAACLSYRTPFASSQEQQDAAGRVRQAMAAPGPLPSPPICLCLSANIYPVRMGFWVKSCYWSEGQVSLSAASAKSCKLRQLFVCLQGCCCSSERLWLQQSGAVYVAVMTCASQTSCSRNLHAT